MRASLCRLSGASPDARAAGVAQGAWLVYLYPAPASTTTFAPWVVPCTLLGPAAMVATYQVPAMSHTCEGIQHARHDWQVLVVSCNLRDKADLNWWAAQQDGDGGERPWLPSALRVSCDSQEWQVSRNLTCHIALGFDAHCASLINHDLNLCYHANIQPRCSYAKTLLAGRRL